MHQFQCQCGAVKGEIEPKGISNRAKCYCADCQAFAHFLGRENDVLDEQGGTEVVQVPQPRVHFTQGVEHLAIMRLSPKGLLRWHTSCCNTPLCNTMDSAKTVFTGFINSALDKGALDADFGPVTAVVNTEDAHGEPKPKGKGLLSSLVKILWMFVAYRIGGKYKQSAFFGADGKPIVTPEVIAKEQAMALKQAVTEKP